MDKPKPTVKPNPTQAPTLDLRAGPGGGRGPAMKKRLAGTNRHAPESLSTAVQSALGNLSKCEAALFLLQEIETGDLGYLSDEMDEPDRAKREWLRETRDWLNQMGLDALEEAISETKGELQNAMEHLKALPPEKRQVKAAPADSEAAAKIRPLRPPAA